MPPFKDIAGKKINRLTAIKVVDKSQGAYRWLCQCDCGETTIVKISKILNNTTKSCGCFNRETIGNISRTHGLGHRTKEYNSWIAMKMRCYSLKDSRYKNYGGRGIYVCERWKNSFPNFLSDMGPKPSNNHTLERLMVNGNYEPTNCIWLEASLQGRNKTNNHYITFNGETKLMADWCIQYNIDASNLIGRLKRGWAIDERLFSKFPKGYRYKK